MVGAECNGLNSKPSYELQRPVNERRQFVAVHCLGLGLSIGVVVIPLGVIIDRLHLVQDYLRRCYGVGWRGITDALDEFSKPFVVGKLVRQFEPKVFFEKRTDSAGH